MKTTIKQATIEAINKVLRLYLTYQAKIMNQYLIEKGFTVVRAKDVNLKRTDVKVRANRNIWLKTENFINYKK